MVKQHRHKEGIANVEHQQYVIAEVPAGYAHAKHSEPGLCTVMVSKIIWGGRQNGRHGKSRDGKAVQRRHGNLAAFEMI